MRRRSLSMLLRPLGSSLLGGRPGRLCRLEVSGLRWSRRWRLRDKPGLKNAWRFLYRRTRAEPEHKAVDQE